jgi:hypothetical protein
MPGMPYYSMRGGPLDNRLVPADHFFAGYKAGELRINVAFAPPVTLKPLPDHPVKLEKKNRVAVYKMSDGETGIAQFVGFEDELHREPSPLADAMMNASDDDILKLIDDIGQAERR